MYAVIQGDTDLSALPTLLYPTIGNLGHFTRRRSKRVFLFLSGGVPAIFLDTKMLYRIIHLLYVGYVYIT